MGRNGRPASPRQPATHFCPTLARILPILSDIKSFGDVISDFPSLSIFGGQRGELSQIQDLQCTIRSTYSLKTKDESQLPFGDGVGANLAILYQAGADFEQ